MVTFIVVLYRRADFSRDQFSAHLRDVHGPMAERLPGLRRYVQHHVADDPTRRDPGWDAVVELGWDDRDTMERAWQSPEGRTATDDLSAFVDVARSAWSIVEAESRL